MASESGNWNLPGNTKRLGLISGIALIILVAGFSIYWLAGSNYKLAFTGLESRDAASIVAELDKLEVKYKVADGGASIYVAEDIVHDVRLQVMASDASVKGGLGYELFDNSDFGMTEFVQKINYQRALQGELARTISSLKEVKYARVHLVVAESSLFRQTKNDSSASVTLYLRDDRVLANRQIRGIQRLVASAVPDLKTNSVVVTDQNGITLTRLGDRTDDVESASLRLQKRLEVELQLTKKINRVLEHTFGKNSTAVSVNISLNLDRIKTTSEMLLPYGEGVTGITKKRIIKQGKSKKGKQTNSTTEIDYKIGRQVDQTILATGIIERMSVAVLVPINTSDRVISQVHDLIAAAVGFDETRDDKIVVHPMKTSKSSVGQFFPNKEPADVQPVAIDNKIMLGDPKPPIQTKINEGGLFQSIQFPIGGKYFDTLDTLWVDLLGHHIGYIDILIVLLAVVVFLSILLVWLTYNVTRMFIRSKHTSPNDLSQEEKEELMGTVSSWLHQADSKRHPDVNI